MNAAELQHALAEFEDVEQADVADILSGSDEGARSQAYVALTRTYLRQAIESAVSLAKEQRFADQSTLVLIEKLAGLVDVDEPYLETLKRLGIQAANAGQLDRAMNIFQSLLGRAVAAGQRRDRRSQNCMRFLHDLEIGAAISTLARGLRKPALRKPGSRPHRLIALCSALQDEDGPSIVTLKRIELFREFGFDVDVVSTELASSVGSTMLAKLQGQGFDFTIVPTGTPNQRIEWITRYVEGSPADAIMYEASGVDCLAQLAAAVRLAPVQAWDHKGFEPLAGQYEIVAQALTPEQVQFSRWPGAAKFYGTPIAIADEIDAAVAFSHEELGLPPDAVVIGTFGRMEKCITGAYLSSLTEILQSEPSAWLLLAGPDALNRMSTVLAHFNAAGVGDRVKYLGRRQSDAPRLVKSLDLYCDTHPWTGGQSLMDAMQAGVPIVAMHKPVDVSLDPSGVAVSAVADVMLGGIVELAQPDDNEGYVRIARSLIRDPALRASNGAKMHQRAVERCSMRDSTFRIASDIQDLIESRG
jgi:glycosyltransferase involved in cell wall biosynthesis